MYLTKIGEYFDIFCAQKYPAKTEFVRNLSSLKSIESAIARVAFSVNQIKIEGLFVTEFWSSSFFFKS